ncbi:MAG TPA: helix-turn-helix domain-containing protein [Pyrinomonadaceae bacterium]|jgi:tetratricopeptide (TPR) repeat protein|nr:helix-turn-helix domain-containing protein [Pyrinomonadaceae bacterium]
MTLSASLLRDGETQTASVDSRVEHACELAKQLENKGLYEDAQQVLSAYWPHPGARPNLKDMAPSVAAELLMRAGVLTGALGGKTQLVNAQETAKNLISESLSVFQSVNYTQKIEEAQVELALCYWRTGEVNEARVLLEETLSRLKGDSDVRCRAIVRLAIVEYEAARFNEALCLLTTNSSLFQEIDNDTLRGSYHGTLGNVLESLWEKKQRSDYLDRALIEYTAASYHFEKVEHRSYLATVQNNLGFLYFKINRCQEALDHLDYARRVLESLSDFTQTAGVDETRASVLLKQGHLSEAERAARSSVQTLENTDRHALLAESLITHGRTLARLGNHNASLSAFQRAISLAQLTGSANKAAEAALAAFHEIGEHLTVRETAEVVCGRTLNEEIQSYEQTLIKRALENAQGSVTHAARSLGVSYQALGYMLETRHKALLSERTPPRRRLRRLLSK